MWGTKDLSLPSGGSCSHGAGEANPWGTDMNVSVLSCRLGGQTAQEGFPCLPSKDTSWEHES